MMPLVDVKDRLRQHLNDPLAQGALAEIERLERDAIRAERHVLISGGDGYGTRTVTGRENMEWAFVLLHYPDAKRMAPTEDESALLEHVQDAEQWDIHHYIGRVSFSERYEDGYIQIYHLTDDVL